MSSVGTDKTSGYGPQSLVHLRQTFLDQSQRGALYSPLGPSSGGVPSATLYPVSFRYPSVPLVIVPHFESRLLIKVRFNPYGIFTTVTGVVTVVADHPYTFFLYFSQRTPCSRLWSAFSKTSSELTVTNDHEKVCLLVDVGCQNHVKIKFHALNQEINLFLGWNHIPWKRINNTNDQTIFPGAKNLVHRCHFQISNFAGWDRTRISESKLRDTNT